VILTFLETTNVVRKERKQEWEIGSDGFAGEEDESMEVGEESVEAEHK